MLSVAEAITLGVMAPYWLQWPLLFKDRYGAGVWVVGWGFCVLGLGKMLGAEAAARILALTSARPRLLSGLTIGTGLALLGAGFLAGRPNQALALLFLLDGFPGARE